MRWGLVTGASSGIGRAFARELAGRGWSLLITGRDADRLAELRSELAARYPAQSFADRALNLVAADAVEQLYEWARNTAGFVEMLVNNAGIGAYGAFAHSSPAKQREMIRLNVEVPTLLAHRFLTEMLEHDRGTLIFVGSVAGFMATPYSTVYGATKAYVGHLALALWSETRGTGVRVHLLAPGLTHTSFHLRALGRDLPPQWQRFADTPEGVVRYALRRMERRPHRCLIVPGFANRWMIRILRLMPTPWSTRITGWVQRWALGQLDRS